MTSWPHLAFLLLVVLEYLSWPTNGHFFYLDNFYIKVSDFSLHSFKNLHFSCLCLFFHLSDFVVTLHMVLFKIFPKKINKKNTTSRLLFLRLNLGAEIIAKNKKHLSDIVLIISKKVSFSWIINNKLKKIIKLLPQE